MKKYTVRVINDLLEARVYTSNATSAEQAEYESRMLYAYSNCPGNITKVIVTERRG